MFIDRSIKDKHFQTISQIQKQNLFVVYGGNVNHKTPEGSFISWKNVHTMDDLCNNVNRND